MEVFTLSFLLTVVLVSALVGLVVWAISRFLFKQAEAREHGFGAFVIIAVIWLIASLV